MHAVQNAHIADNHPCLVITWHYVNQKGQLVAGPIGERGRSATKQQFGVPCMRCKTHTLQTTIPAL